MPYSLEYILEHADEFARRFEEMEPDPSKFKDARPLAAIYRGVQARAQAEREIVQAVRDARAEGFAWWVIGGYLGTSGEAARQRYGKLIAA